MSHGSPTLAEEVLYCVDTQAVGFTWDKRGQASVSKFVPERFTIKIVTETERVITRMTGDTPGWSIVFTCKRPYPTQTPEQIACDERRSQMPWVFHRNTYLRAILMGPPGGGSDPNSQVAYGTCTKF
jgi:hypothetical protein